MQHPIAATLVLLAATCASAATPNPPPPLQGGFEDTLCHSVPAHKVAEVDFLAFFGRRADAESAARLVDPDRFAVTVRRSSDQPDWVLRAVYRELPTQARLDADTENLVPRWRALGGRYPAPGCRSPTLRLSGEEIARLRGGAADGDGTIDEAAP